MSADKSIMKNITAYIPELYEKNIQLLISKNIIGSRSEAIRTAIREFLHREYNINLPLLNYEGDYDFSE